MFNYRKKASINFVKSPSKNYEQVQNNILGIITNNLPSKKYTFSDNELRDGKLNMTLFIRRPGDVIMSHGVADKNYLFRRVDGNQLVNNFSNVFVPGPWMKRKLLSNPQLNHTEESIHIVGWPRIEYLQGLRRKKNIEDNMHILWAPTHDFRKQGIKKESTSSYPGFIEDAKCLAEIYHLEKSLHPRNRKIKTVTGQQLVDCDVVISDFGTMVYEAWAMGKPVIFPRWVLKNLIQEFIPNSAEAFIHENKIGYHPDSYDEMMDILKSGPVITSDVEYFMEDYLPSSLYSCSGKIIADTLLRLAGNTF